MQYRKNQKNGDELSVLGYGCLRYTKKGGSIDQEKAEKEMALAIERGVNYFDTAYTYGGSEACLGKFLKKYGYRDRVKIATKLPHYYIKKLDDMERYFAEELERLQTDYIDYYLMHMLNDPATWQRLTDLGIRDWIAEKKEKGIIKNIGFSFHGGTAQFKELIDSYDWDFCQIQYNYMDEYNQAGREGLEYAHDHGIPVIIMEPLRGGRLVNQLPPDAVSEFKKADANRSPAEWGLRWIWNHKQVNVILSGMNDVAQVEENCRIASLAQIGDFGDKEMELFERVKTAINASVKVGCTGCGYCMPCPQGVDIPTSFSCYNRSYTDGWFTGLKTYYQCTSLRKNKTIASKCVGCGKCEKHCPQKIQIREELKNVKKRLEGPAYQATRIVLDRVYKY
ncbi:MAG: aldo/keto reductase [bacterium]|nr:aldo/keto reductase [bacterium]